MSETEADTRANRIDPVLREADWGVAEGSQVQRELICPGRILAGGQRGTALSADYVLSYRGRKLAVIEAKRAGMGYGAGVGQAKDYARRLQARFAYATDGIGWCPADERSRIASRRCASAMPAFSSHHAPPSSGPRWLSRRDIAAARSSKVCRSPCRGCQNPVMPHIDWFPRYAIFPPVAAPVSADNRCAPPRPCRPVPCEGASDDR